MDKAVESGYHSLDDAEFPILMEGFKDDIPRIMSQLARRQELNPDDLALWNRFKEHSAEPTNRGMELIKQQIDLLEGLPAPDIRRPVTSAAARTTERAIDEPAVGAAKDPTERTAEELLGEIKSINRDAKDLSDDLRSLGPIPKGEILDPLQTQGFRNSIPLIMTKIAREGGLTSKEASLWNEYKQVTNSADASMSPVANLRKQQIELLEEARYRYTPPVDEVPPEVAAELAWRTGAEAAGDPLQLGFKASPQLARVVNQAATDPTVKKAVKEGRYGSTAQDAVGGSGPPPSGAGVNPSGDDPDVLRKLAIISTDKNQTEAAARTLQGHDSVHKRVVDQLRMENSREIADHFGYKTGLLDHIKIPDLMRFTQKVGPSMFKRTVDTAAAAKFRKYKEGMLHLHRALNGEYGYHVDAIHSRLRAVEDPETGEFLVRQYDKLKQAMTEEQIDTFTNMSHVFPDDVIKALKDKKNIEEIMYFPRNWRLPKDKLDAIELEYKKYQKLGGEGEEAFGRFMKRPGFLYPRSSPDGTIDDYM